MSFYGNIFTANGFYYTVVKHLPTPQEAKEHLIYLCPNKQNDNENYYDEYILINSQWERISGDLTKYVTKVAFNNAAPKVEGTTLILSSTI